ncbi:MAG: NADP-dependent malic enzyme [Oligoflexia bacterium]|nr:NADP-dependent malic enzyme [Oligoflexia bacterium]
MKIAEESLALHERLKGKLSVTGKYKLNYDNLSLLYTPGVSAPCLKIAEKKETVYDYTWKWNSVAVISDGSRVLGLGNIGPLASMPLLEGKALIFRRFGGLDAIPLPIASLSIDESINVIKSVQYSFGGINLEDISTPRCYEILDRLTEELDIPIWHDDQQGTATIIAAALINAAKITGRDLRNINIVLFGSGAANTAVYRLLRVAGLSGKQFRVFNSKGVLGTHRKELLEIPVLRKICEESNPEGENVSFEECLKNADALIALSKPGPGVITQAHVRLMKKSPVVFACANPVPEIEPGLAIEAGAAVVATGTSLYPNQANNALVFPGMYRGGLDVRTSAFTWGMCFDVANEIATIAEEKGLRPDYIVPKIDEPNLHFRVAKAAAKSAIKEGVARLSISDEKLEKVISDNLDND